MKTFFACFIIAFVFINIAACSVTTHSSTAHTRNINETGIHETANIADLKVEEQKVTGTSTGVSISDETARDLAVYDAVKKSGADVLVEPNYDIDHTGSAVTVTVTGYPGFYKNFRRPTLQDSIIMGWKVIVPVCQAVPSNTNCNTVVTITTANVNVQQGTGNLNTDIQGHKK